MADRAQDIEADEAGGFLTLLDGEVSSDPADDQRFAIEVKWTVARNIEEVSREHGRLVLGNGLRRRRQGQV